MTHLLIPFLIGLAGGLHCIGMCSPLVLAASGRGRNSIYRNLQYNLGRIVTYSVLGIIVSFAGKGLYMAGLQQWVAIAAGMIALVVGITSTRIAFPIVLQKYIFRFSNSLKHQFRQILNSRNSLGMLTLGMLNGILPCGVTLLALGYCLTLGSPTDGLIAMILFGLGTLPAMAGFSWIVTRMALGQRMNYRTIQTSLLIISGILLLSRGISNFDTTQSHSTAADGIVVCGGTVVDN